MILSQCCSAPPSLPDCDPPAICSRCGMHSGFDDEDQLEMLEPSLRPGYDYWSSENDAIFSERQFNREQEDIIEAIIKDHEGDQEGPQE